MHEQLTRKKFQGIVMELVGASGVGEWEHAEGSWLIV